MDEEHIINYFENIIEICDKTTTGNVSHQKGLITSTYKYIANKIKDQYGDIAAYHNLLTIVDIASILTLDNISYKIGIIKAMCIRNIDFIKEFGIC